MYIVGMGLIKVLQPWDILLIYCNNQLKKYITLLLTLARGALSTPLLMSVSEAFSVPFHFNKILLHKSSWVIKSGPCPEAKSSSLEITNLTPFTISYQKDWKEKELWGALFFPFLLCRHFHLNWLANTEE